MIATPRDLAEFLGAPLSTLSTLTTPAAYRSWLTPPKAALSMSPTVTRPPPAL